MAQDDWHEETQSRLEKSILFQSLKAKCSSDPSGFQVLALVDEAVLYAFQRTKTILFHMGEYTLHDGDHLFRVLKLMEALLPASTIEELTTPELMLLILSAFFHDIGMAPEEKAVLTWKKVWDKDPVLEDDAKEEFENFHKFYTSRPDRKLQIERFIQLGDHSNADLLKSYLISDYIRSTHADRARVIIEKDWLEKIRYRDTDLVVEFANICFSHNEDVLSLLDMDMSYLCGPEVRACLPLIALILRLADLLDFDAKRTPSILFSHLFVRHPVSIAEWNKHRAVESWSIGPDRIQFHAKCKHPAIEASIHAFCDLIDNELAGCNNIIAQINRHNQSAGRDVKVQIPFRVDRTKIGTEKDIHNKPIYIYRETQFNLSKEQVIDLLMGTKLYGDPEVALRELVQNSIDACLLRGAMERAWGNQYIPEIRIRRFKDEGDEFLEVIDNGVGMDQHIIDNYYSKIGSSFYKSPDFFEIKAEMETDFIPTSRFGIGILSCFMVADSLEVETRKVDGPHKSSEPIKITIEGQDSIFWIRAGEQETPGTRTKLLLRQDGNPWIGMDDQEFIQSVESVVPNPPVNIVIASQSMEKTRNTDDFKELSANTLKNYSWHSDDNIQKFEIKFGEVAAGLVGSAVVAVLVDHGTPVRIIEMKSKTIDIEHESFDLKKSMKLSGSRIELETTTITIDEDGDIDASDSTSTLAQSQSKLSLHGIEIPMTLFPPQWNRRKGQVALDWPIPLLLILDVCGDRDLDLNSSRTEVLKNEKWFELEEELAFQIFSSVATEVCEGFWPDLEEVLASSTKNDRFLAGLGRIKE